MSEVAALITDMIHAGVDPDIIGRTAELLCNKSNVTRNASGKSKNAERQARYRARKKEQEQNSNVTRNVTPCDKKEKEPKRKNINPSQKEKPPKGVKKKKVSLPDWLDNEIWDEYVQHRKQMRKPLTAKAEKMAIGKLDRMRMSGNDPTAVITQTLENGWTGLFELKGDGNGKSGNNSAHARMFAGFSQADC